LAGLTNLEVLLLDGNQITNVLVLADLNKLEELLLDFNQIADLRPLALLVGTGLLVSAWDQVLPERMLYAPSNLPSVSVNAARLGIYSADGSPVMLMVAGETASANVTLPNGAGTTTVSFSTGDGSFSGTVPVRVVPASFTNAPSAGTVGQAYSFTFTHTAGFTPVSSTITGSVPPGLTLSGLKLAGTPTKAGTYTVTVTATDAYGQKLTQAFTIKINPAANVPVVHKYRQFTLSPDLTGDKLGEVVGVDQAGVLDLYPGKKDGSLGARVQLGKGFGSFQVYAPGDWNGDGKADLMATDSAGKLFLYPGTGAGKIGVGAQIGKGWSSYRIIPSGDMNGDKTNDLLAIDSAGLLWLYPGNGKGGWLDRYQVGKGWIGYDLYAAGDVTGDKKADILSIDSTGLLWLYAGQGNGTFKARVQVGKGWTGYTLACGADIDADGLSDLVGRDAKGVLYFYGGKTGGTFKTKIQIATGW
jgi:hypothetical protein